MLNYIIDDITIDITENTIVLNCIELLSVHVWVHNMELA